MTISLNLGKRSKLRLNLGNGMGVVHPDVHRLTWRPHGIPYWLFYTPYPPDEAELPYLAMSHDGSRFETFKGPLLNRGSRGSWDSHHLADVDVFVDGETRWLMYYAGANTEDEEKTVSIGVATSTDGLSWRKSTENPILKPSSSWWEAGVPGHKEVSGPAVLNVNGEYLMYYSALNNDGLYNIALAVSSDGIKFKKKGLVLKPELPWEEKGLTHPDIVRLGPNLLILYVGEGHGTRSLGLAYGDVNSPRRLRKLGKPVLVAKGPVELGWRMPKLLRTIARKANLRICWDCWFIYRSCLLSSGDGMLFDRDTLLYYSAYDLLAGVPSIGVARARLEG